MPTNSEARKGIKTEEGTLMADKAFQLDRSAADLNDDGTVSAYEQIKGEAMQKAKTDEIPKMYHGGMPCGMMSEELPLGSTENEVADDITAMISENEYVLDARTVKWHGLKHIMEMQQEADMGLMSMYDMGLIVEVDRETEEPDSESAKDAEVSAEGDTEQEETEETIETPEGNEIEVAGIETDYAEPLLEETEEYLANDYGKNSEYGTMTKQKFAFIV